MNRTHRRVSPRAPTVPRAPGMNRWTSTTTASTLSVPARAGMNRSPQLSELVHHPVPRARGDEPVTTAHVQALRTRSPARRGMNRSLFSSSIRWSPFPRARDEPSPQIRRFCNPPVPRARGDEPYPEAKIVLCADRSPRARG